MVEPQRGPHVTRREIVGVAGALLAGASTSRPRAHAAAEAFPLPGALRGRVVEVSHPASVVAGQVNAAAVRAMMTRGMCELVGTRDEREAWRRFVQPGDVVAVKVCPVGRPLSISQPETILEVFRGLNLAGIPNQDIVLFNRYKVEILACGYEKILPPGVRMAWGSENYDSFQVDTTGYDTSVFVEMNRVMTGQDPNNPVHRRSHLALAISKEVTKIINVCCLKDHASAGLTMALKNLSHGFVNNVVRSHATRSQNWCDTFIPDVVGMPALRRKVVLNIGDGLIGCYDGGPGTWNKHFATWEHRALFFGTDPVAMDRIGWRILDRRRGQEGLPPLAETGYLGKNKQVEAFDFRQPQHVLLAAMAGLGEADLDQIEHRRIALA